MIKRIKNDNGFMGPTHALSAIAIYLLIAALIPNILFNNILQTDNIFIFIASIFIIAGSAVLPDLDNTKSTAISTLGILGKLLSKGMRAFSVMIYFAIKGERDDNNPNPHRGFWHTLVSSLLVLFIVTLTTSLPGSITLPILNKESKISFLFACIWIFVCLQLSLASLFGQATKKIKKNNFFGSLFITIVTILVTVSILAFAPSTLSYSWIGAVMALGYTIHILGDTLTVAGTPLLWPYKNKGKRWWTYRLLKIKAGGPIEYGIFIPLFSTITIFSLVKLLMFLAK